MRSRMRTLDFTNRLTSKDQNRQSSSGGVELRSRQALLLRQARRMKAREGGERMWGSGIIFTTGAIV